VYKIRVESLAISGPGNTFAVCSEVQLKLARELVAGKWSPDRLAELVDTFAGMDFKSLRVIFGAAAANPE
jgi:hypothetical protein